MGSLQFLLPRRSEVAALATRCGYMVGQDGTPWDSRVEQRGGRLVLESDARESGRLITPYQVDGYGLFALGTSTLSPRVQPYHLPLELLRGTLHRVLEYLASLGQVESTAEAELEKARTCFVRAALSQADHDLVTKHAEAGLMHCMAIMRQQMSTAGPSSDNPDDYAARFTGFHAANEATIDAIEQSAAPGNSVCFVPTWRELEPNPGEWKWNPTAAQFNRLAKLGKRIVCGPLFQLERSQLPDWLYLWEDDFDSLQSYVVSFVQAAAEKLQSLTHVWYTSSGTNVDRELKLSEEQRLRLTLTILETLRRVDPQTPTLVGIKQPWGDYMGRGTWDLSPWQFADILVRSGIAVTGFAIELDFACDGSHTMPRDLLEVERQLDLWASFGRPLVLVISADTTSEKEGENAAWMAHLRDVLELVHKKQYMQGIFWTPFQDSAERQNGIVDLQQTPKPLLKDITEVWGS